MREKDSTPKGGVFVKQPSADNEVIGLSHNPSKSPKKKEKRRRTRSISSHHHHHPQVDQSHPAKEV